MTTTLYVSSATGSSKLVPRLQEHDVPVVCGRLDSGDIEWLGWTGVGPTPIGAEHKNAVTSDIFTSMQDGRLVGEQMPKLVRAYPWVRYLIIEGNLRRGKDGVLEIKKWNGGQWEQAFSRNGKGWTYDEFENRIESVCEFWSYPHVAGRTFVKRTYDDYESAAYIVGRLRYWSKQYEDHSSARQWHSKRDLPAMHPLIPTSEVPLVQLWASDIEGIGPKKSTFVARAFGSAYSLANATAADWAKVEMMEARKGQHALVTKHFSKEMIGKFMRQIGHPDAVAVTEGERRRTG